LLLLLFMDVIPVISSKIINVPPSTKNKQTNKKSKETFCSNNTLSKISAEIQL